MELKYLYTVRKILETGSYQNAAQALNYAQSTITFQIKQLEAELSVKLFEKKGQSMVLTPAGQDILPLIDRLLADAEALKNYKNQLSDRKWHLHIAMPETLATYKLQPLLKKFHQQAPETMMSISVLNCYKIFDELIHGDVDIAVHYNVGRYPPGIVHRKLCECPLVLVGSPDMNPAQTDFITPHQYKAIYHLHDDADALSLKLWHQYIKQRHIQVEGDMNLGSVETIRRSVRSGLGISLLPRFVVSKDIEDGDMQELPLATPVPAMTAIYAFRRHSWINPAMRLFLDLLDNFQSEEEQARLHPAVTAGSKEMPKKNEG